MKARQLWIPAKVLPQLKQQQKEAEQDGAYRVAKRIHAVLLNASHKTSGEISGILNAPRSRVSEWLRNYQQFGFDGLLEGQRSGRPALLTEKQLLHFADILDSGPVAYGFLSGVWTSPMAGRILEEEFGVRYHKVHICRLMHQLGFSMQRPKRLLARADEAQQNRWRRQTFPNIKKKPKKKRG